MGMTLHLDIVSAESELFSGRAQRVSVSGVQGELGIMPGHAPLLTALKPGTVRVQMSDEKEELFYISGGMLEVQPDLVTVLADIVTRAADLDEAAALEAQKQAQALLAGKKAAFDYSKAIAQLAEAAAQLRAIEQLRKKAKRGH